MKFHNPSITIQKFSPQARGTVPYLSCVDPEIFMRGVPTKMVIFGHRQGGGGV